MKLLLAAATAAAALVAVGSASAQSMYGHDSGYGQSYQQPTNAWRGSSYAQTNWGRRDRAGYGASYGGYNRNGYAQTDWGRRDRAGYGASYGGYNRNGDAGHGVDWRNRDDWRRNESYGPMGSRAYPSYGVSFAIPFQRARSH